MQPGTVTWAGLGLEKKFSDRTVSKNPTVIVIRTVLRQ